MRCNTILIQLLLLSEGLPGVAFGDIHVYTIAEGQDIEVQCRFRRSERKRFFCKNDCDKKENILVETTGNRAEKGRYSIQFDEQNYRMTVGIKKLQMSDSGQYQCYLKRTFWSDRLSLIDSKDEFKIEVTKVIQTTAAVRPTQRPGPSPDPVSFTTIRPERSLLFVAPAVAGVVLLVSAALVVFYCKKRVNRPQGPHVNTGVQQIIATEDCTYQSLNLNSTDPNQTYSTLLSSRGLHHTLINSSSSRLLLLETAFIKTQNLD